VTERHFWTDAYCRELDTHVTRISGDTVWLARTVFFAESGGQESDFGSIGGVPVLLATLTEGDISYQLSPQHGLVSGQAVHVSIDWARRYALMRLHFAAEVVLEIASRHFGLTEKIGAHIGPLRARIDFAHGTPVTPLLAALRDRAQALVAADLPIVSDWQDKASERRFWHVEGFATVPCGGTHLHRTSEVGQIALARKNIGKGKERIEITVGNLTPSP
jgi:Ser-tRNA(Ala) deacylase AlaX